MHQSIRQQNSVRFKAVKVLKVKGVWAVIALVSATKVLVACEEESGTQSSPTPTQSSFAFGPYWSESKAILTVLKHMDNGIPTQREVEEAVFHYPNGP